MASSSKPRVINTTTQIGWQFQPALVQAEVAIVAPSEFGGRLRAYDFLYGYLVIGALCGRLLRWFFSAIGAAIVQNSVDKTVNEAQINTSLWPPLVAGSRWLLLNWLGVTGWVLLLTLALAVWFTYRDDKKLRAARILEYYALHLF